MNRTQHPHPGTKESYVYSLKSLGRILQYQFKPGFPVHPTDVDLVYIDRKKHGNITLLENCTSQSKLEMLFNLLTKIILVGINIYSFDS